MALVIKDRVKESSTTTGTGTYTLAGAEAGHQTFSVIGDGNTTYYAATDGTYWEVGIGTYTASGTTLARTTILSSSNSNNAVDWTAGEKLIFVTQPSSKAAFLDASNNAGDIGDIIATLTGNVTGNLTGNVTGNATGSSSKVDAADNVKSTWGNSDDLEIWHDGVSSTSYFIESNATGNMEFRASSLRLKEADGGNYYFLGVGGGASTIYHNGSQKLATTASGISVSGNVTVSGTVDGRDIATDGATLDNIETEVAALANGMVYKGDWDASAGSFPSGAQTGWFYYVSVAGTVNSVVFHVGDNIVATTDNASTTTYAGNWSKHDNTDAVQSVVGLIGSITKSSLLTAINVEDGADVTDTTNVTAAGALMDSEVTNLAQVKAFNSTDYATAAQGTTADNAVPKAGGTMTGTLFTPTVDFGDWTITETGGSLYFAYSGTNKFKLDSSGTLSVTNDVQTDQTIT